MGKAEGEGDSKEGQGCPEESVSSPADESCYAQEVVGDDEGTVGGEEEVGVIAQPLSYLQTRHAK